MLARAALVERLLELAWSHWTALGVAGAVVASEEPVDLEALLILTAELASDDARLRDEALDWCSRYHGYISKPRLKQLLRRSLPSTQDSFGGFANVLERHVSGRWPAATRVASSTRGPSALSDKSRLPPLVRPALLNLRLRALFGVSARADVIGSVLLHPSGDFGAADLSFIGYSKRNLADALDMLARAGLFRSARVGNRVRFSWRRQGALVALLDPLPARIPRWAISLRVMSALVDFATRVHGKSERLRAVEAARCLREITGDLQALGVDASASADLVGQALEDWLLGTIAELIGDNAARALR